MLIIFVGIEKNSMKPEAQKALYDYTAKDNLRGYNAHLV
jgi:hypothetical protein